MEVNGPRGRGGGRRREGGVNEGAGEGDTTTKGKRRRERVVDEDKVERRKRRNRESAAQHRQKKEAHIAFLQSQVEELTEENRRLRGALAERDRGYAELLGEGPATEDGDGDGIMVPPPDPEHPQLPSSPLPSPPQTSGRQEGEGAA